MLLNPIGLKQKGDGKVSAGNGHRFRAIITRYGDGRKKLYVKSRKVKIVSRHFETNRLVLLILKDIFILYINMVNFLYTNLVNFQGGSSVVVLQFYTLLFTSVYGVQQYGHLNNN